MLQPTLTTARLRLEPLTDEHLVHEVALDGNAEVMRFVGGGRPRDADEVALAHAGRMSRARNGLGFWAGFSGTAFVGWWLLTPANGDRRGDAELGMRHVATRVADSFDAIAGAEDGEVDYAITAEQWRSRAARRR